MYDSRNYKVFKSYLYGIIYDSRNYQVLIDANIRQFFFFSSTIVEIIKSL